MPLRIRPVAFRLSMTRPKEYPGLAVYHEALLGTKDAPPFAIIPGYAKSIADVLFDGQWASFKVIADGGIVIGEEFQAVLATKPDGRETKHRIER